MKILAKNAVGKYKAGEEIPANLLSEERLKTLSEAGVIEVSGEKPKTSRKTTAKTEKAPSETDKSE